MATFSPAAMHTTAMAGSYADGRTMVQTALGSSLRVTMQHIDGSLPTTAVGHMEDVVYPLVQQSTTTTSEPQQARTVKASILQHYF